METEKIERLKQFFDSFKYEKSSSPSATMATKSLPSINTVTYAQLGVATKIATSATNPLDRYISYLESWVADGKVNLPDVPSFPDRPEHAIAWSAWWDAVEICRKNRDSK